MDLIKIIDSAIVPSPNNELLLDLVFTIPKGSYIEHMYIVDSVNVTTEGDLTDSNFDIVTGLLDAGLCESIGDFHNQAFAKISSTSDGYDTYRFNKYFTWLNNNGDWGEAIIIKDDIVFVTLQIDTSTEAKYKADCSESKVTIPVYNRTRMLVDIADLGRLIGGCDPCKDIPESFVKTIMEFRAFETAVEIKDWLMVKRLYNDIYNTSISKSSISYSLTRKCNCNV